MTLCSFQNVSLAFGEINLLQAVSFDLEEGAHVGLCGGNGMGKSTLLRLLSGALTPDAGRVEFFKPVSVGLLAQTPAPDPGCAPNPEFLQTLSVMGGDAGLAAAPAATLSGGERMKLALARLLAEQPELLLLDEPSNNLDYEGVRALIEAVNRYPGTLLVVSHDRYFLDQTASTILELENGAITEYMGGYSDYRDEKERRFGERLRRWEEGARQQTRLEDSIRQAKGWGEKAHRDSTKKDDGRVMGAKEFRRKKAEKLERRAKNQVRRLERLREDVGERPRGEAQVWFAMESGEKKGRRILEADGLAMAFGEKRLFADTSFALLRGERAALFGPNGCGKTTFVKLLQGELTPSAGRLRVSPASAPFVLSQDILNLPAQHTPLAYFRGLFGALTGEQRTLLACMGLSARHLEQRIETLSLGERMKVKLAELIFSKRDFLVLDEPTNSLDLHARETLEDALATYPGTLLVVSHDLYFLERVCDKTLVFEDERIVRREQTFAEYIAIREEN